MTSKSDEPGDTAPANEEEPIDRASGEQAGTGARSLTEVDFSTFVLSLSASAIYNLGEMPHPETARAEKNLPLAKQTIDILGMLQDKTRGNLTHDEEQLLTSLLFDLRVKFVAHAKS